MYHCVQLLVEIESQELFTWAGLNPLDRIVGVSHQCLASSTPIFIIPSS
jgi:hypothetical protein